MSDLTWVEISKDALASNIKQFRALIGNDVILCPCVKANAYGHGLVAASRIFLEAGADWLCVNSLYEAAMLRGVAQESQARAAQESQARAALEQAPISQAPISQAPISQAPIYILGYVPLDSLAQAAELNCRLVVYDSETIEKLGEIGCSVKVHIKVETGNNRQGVLLENLVDFAKNIQKYKNIEIEGLATHFANIEDTTDHSFAETQIERFKRAVSILADLGINVLIKHCANSAATILFPETHFQMVRVGIACYGMWPSNETYASYLQQKRNDVELKPAFTWKAKIAQIKKVPSGEYIGYGCTYKTGRDTRIAIIPVGYYDGYDREVNGAHVLICGKRAPLCGRVCMNIIMADVTDIPEAGLENIVTLIGQDGDEIISAEQFAKWIGTINYEVTTRVNERIPRIVV